MKKLKQLDHSTWNRTTGLRILLALGSLISMILASGAGSQWN